MLQQVVILGCGNIGLPLAVAFATTGMTVLGYDTDSDRVASLAAGADAGDEPELAAALGVALESGRLSFSEHITSCLGGPTAYVVTVPTPWVDEVGFDDRALRAAIAAVFTAARPGDLLCIRSTVPVGTTSAIAREAAERGLRIGVASCPDRSVEGQGLREQFALPHLVGADEAEAQRDAAQLFGRLGSVTLCTSSAEAEAAKLLCNVARDAMFGLSNELARFCVGLGLDGRAVAAAAGQGYPRFALPRPGPVGGPCLSKDSALLLGSPGAPESPLLRAARRANADIPGEVANAIADHIAAIGGANVALLGLAFKGRPAVADLRGSAGLEIARLLQRRGLRVIAWDAEVDAASLERNGLVVATSPLAASAGAGVVLLANDHPALAELDIAALAGVAHRQALIYDLCGEAGDCAAVLLPGQRYCLLGCRERAAAPARAAAE